MFVQLTIPTSEAFGMCGWICMVYILGLAYIGLAQMHGSIQLTIFLSISFRNSEHWHDLHSFVVQYKQPPLPGMPSKPS